MPETPSDLEEQLARRNQKGLLRFSTAGSVDDGKSTMIGRLLHDSKCLFEDTLQALQQQTNPGDEPDLALITDGLRAERDQKITIDVAYRYFSTPKRSFILADTPGHEQYTRNMATGASTANAAIVLIDARKGLLPQTRRHSFILSLLGVKHVLVAVNKMDLVDYQESVFLEIQNAYRDFAAKLDLVDVRFVPISSLEGANVVHGGGKMAWFTGETVLEYLENLYVGSDRNLIDFRMPVQTVIRPSQDFRGYAGQLSSGALRPGDEVVVLPSMQRSRVGRIFTYDGDLEIAFAPMSVGVTLEDEIDVGRGYMFVPPNNLPHASTSIEAMIVWMAKVPLQPGKTYYLRHTSREVKCEIRVLRYRVNVNTLSREEAKALGLNEIGRADLELHSPIFWDSYERSRLTGNFVLIDPIDHGTVAAGMILDRKVEAKVAKEERPQRAASNVSEERGGITRGQRESQMLQQGMTIWLTGLSASGKSTIAKALEASLFADGRKVYRLDGDNVRLGLNKNLGFSSEDRSENIRRVAEVARLMNDAGLIVIAAFISPFEEDRARAKEIIGEDSFVEVFVRASLATCKERDPKGLYEKARLGQIKDFTGVQSPYEEPADPDIVVDTGHHTVEECTQDLLKALKALKISPG